MIKDTFLTISHPTEGEYKEKGSKFLAYAFPMSHEKELDIFLSNLKEIHPKARHYCFAYKLGLDNNRFRANDDGEPSGTAGKPILGQIQSFGLTDVVIIVIRYFGGTKLGASGLIHAYKQSALEALEKAEIITKHLYVQYLLVFGYDHMGHILNILKEMDILIKDKKFESECDVIIQLRLSLENDTIHRLKAKLLNKSMEEVNEETELDFCKILKVSMNNLTS